MARRSRKPFGERLIANMSKGLEDIRNNRELSTAFVPTPPDPPKFDRHDLAELRRNLRMTQAGLAAFLNVSEKTVESWEQGNRNPNGAALRLLQVMQDPSLLAPFSTGSEAAARSPRKVRHTTRKKVEA
jgi:DNA-binding transcriptional regulator YiaG